LPPGRAATTGLILELPGIINKIQGVNEFNGDVIAGITFNDGVKTNAA